MISAELLKILACPACENRPSVELNRAGSGLLCRQCGRLYPVRDDIPIMLTDEAVLTDISPASAPDVKPPSQ